MAFCWLAVLDVFGGVSPATTAAKFRGILSAIFADVFGGGVSLFWRLAENRRLNGHFQSIRKNARR
jgi:hypothetical protein